MPCFFFKVLNLKTPACVRQMPDRQAINKQIPNLKFKIQNFPEDKLLFVWDFCHLNFDVVCNLAIDAFAEGIPLGEFNIKNILY